MGTGLTQTCSLDHTACEIWEIYPKHSKPTLQTLKSDSCHTLLSWHLNFMLCQIHYVSGLSGLLVSKCIHIKLVEVKGLQYLEDISIN